MRIRPLDPLADLKMVEKFYQEAPDYWELAEGRTPGSEKTKAFFYDGPPNCDPDVSHRLGLFLDGRLSGLAELSFGFPDDGDAYLGFMMLGSWARNTGIGRKFLAHVEDLARRAGASNIYLAVMAANPKGRAFWEREGFVATGLSRESNVGDLKQELHRLVKTL